jgi:hypothetical protein
LEEATGFGYFSRLLERKQIFLIISKHDLDALGTSDILFITETHVSPVRPLPNIAIITGFLLVDRRPDFQVVSKAHAQYPAYQGIPPR